MITVRSFGDWITIHQDNNLLFEGHSVKAVDLIDILYNFDEVDYKEELSNDN